MSKGKIWQLKNNKEQISSSNSKVGSQFGRYTLLQEYMNRWTNMVWRTTEKVEEKQIRKAQTKRLIFNNAGQFEEVVATAIIRQKYCILQIKLK